MPGTVYHAVQVTLVTREGRREVPAGRSPGFGGEKDEEGQGLPINSLFLG